MNLKSEIDLADSLMSISQALTAVTGDYYPTFEEGTSPKLRCPYTGLYHENPKTLRLYPSSNSAYCFSCNDYMTPTRLIAAFRELSLVEAVEWIKSETGYTPPDPEELWDAMAAEEEARPDRQALSDALKVACSRMAPDWDSRQFDEQVSHRFSLCLGLLKRVKTEADGKVWLDKSRQAMGQILGFDKAP